MLAARSSLLWDAYGGLVEVIKTLEVKFGAFGGEEAELGGGILFSVEIIANWASAGFQVHVLHNWE